MRTFLVSAALVLGGLSPIAARAEVLRDGLYVPTRSNNSSTCPQRVRASHREGKLVSIRVVYSGDCADQGPYAYDCEERAGHSICSGNAESFEVHSPDSYTWRNHSYDIWGVFDRRN